MNHGKDIYECPRLFFNQNHILNWLTLGILNDFIFISVYNKNNQKKDVRLASYGHILFIVVYISMINLTNILFIVIYILLY